MNFRFATLLLAALGASITHAEEEKAAPKPYVYEGRSAAEWAKDLKAGKDKPKAMHALHRLGKDALPSIIELLKEKDPATMADVAELLTNIDPDKNTLVTFAPLLNDENFEVRRTAVNVLGKTAMQDPALTPAVQDAIKPALDDRDRAVAEAAEDALNAIEQRDRQLADKGGKTAIEKHLSRAVEAGNNKDFARAEMHLNEARQLAGNNPKTLAKIDAVAAVIQKGQFAGDKIADMNDFANDKGGKRGPMNAKAGELERNKEQVAKTLLRSVAAAENAGDFEMAMEILMRARMQLPENQAIAEEMAALKRRMAENAGELKQKKFKVPDPDMKKRDGETRKDKEDAPNF